MHTSNRVAGFACLAGCYHLRFFPVAISNDAVTVVDMSTMIDNTLLSVSEAAELLGCTTGRVRQLLLAGVIAGQKLHERAWIIRKEAVDAYRKNRRGVGRPKATV